MEPYELTDRDAELLSAYIDDALDADQRASLEARLAQDADLRRELRSLQQTVALVRSLTDVRAPRDFTLTPEMVGLGDPTPAEQARPALKIVPRRRNIWQIAMTSAAAFVLVFAGALVVMRVLDNQSAPTEMPAQVAVAPTLTAEAVADEAADEPENANLMVATLAQTTLAQTMTVQVEGYSSRQAIEATPVITIVDGVAIVTPAVNMPSIDVVTPLPTQSISTTTLPGAVNDTGMVVPVSPPEDAESDDSPSDQTFAMEAPPTPSEEPIALAVQQATPTPAPTLIQTQARGGGAGMDTDGEAEIEMAEEAQDSMADSAAMESAPSDADAGLGGAASSEESAAVPKVSNVFGMLLGGLYRSSAGTTLFRLPDDQVITLQDALDMVLRIAAGIASVEASR